MLFIECKRVTTCTVLHHFKRKRIGSYKNIVDFPPSLKIDFLPDAEGAEFFFMCQRMLGKNVIEQHPLTRQMQSPKKKRIHLGADRPRLKVTRDTNDIFRGRTPLPEMWVSFYIPINVIRFLASIADLTQGLPAIAT